MEDKNATGKRNLLQSMPTHKTSVWNKTSQGSNSRNKNKHNVKLEEKNDQSRNQHNRLRKSIKCQ